ncbi:hypothetical protein HPB50_018436 [Hyalomma asiaticum]|uniref:Uncharacterized protein n=1 Tax=Hyalomma asiaticum TaxID=266040 RepID=A0ACB7S3L0_HYAAI|nr:hypothetical protein HPB50_018436 [Hyalomma asiaticum]
MSCVIPGPAKEKVCGKKHGRSPKEVQWEESMQEREENEKRCLERAKGRRRWEIPEHKTLASRDRVVRQVQGAPTIPNLLVGTWPQGLPAVTVQGRILTARSTSPDLMRPRKVGLPAWLSHRATVMLRVEPNTRRSSHRALTCWQARYPGFNGDLVSIASSSENNTL